MAFPENESTEDDVQTEEQAEAAEELRDLEPKKDVKGGFPIYQ